MSAAPPPFFSSRLSLPLSSPPRPSLQNATHTLTPTPPHLTSTRYAEREDRRKEDQRNGAAVIITQMRERELDRVRQLELQDQEREAMLRQNHEMKEEEIRQVRVICLIIALQP